MMSPREQREWAKPTKPETIRVADMAFLIAGIFAMMAAIVILTGIRDRNGMDNSIPPCYEDSVLMWDGETNGHTKCVPLDDL